ncbi:SDR family oxidoreductase [Proteiniclasticum sp. SCR006]|uniref:SDR family oxidoreductase n=1 Tax=Proteiniclasticum aestuarii TaxID=2817862 RepID=A0A939HB93_9CLOT|nr:SDR family oxidoreductase [Proteiniclasticum aestuarii]MBO1264836.1 SDR family oxidoreductase [Proteiniclasticum aestuarii]
MRVNGKIAVITGANSGMGKASARMLAEKGYHVVMLVRNRERGKEALEELEKAFPGSFQMILCDLSDGDSVRAAAEEISRKCSGLDILLNNAGLITTKRQLNEVGLEMQFAVNHVGHFILTLTLLPLMREGARIVQVASGAHKWGEIHFDDLTLEKNFRPFKAYGQSKLANVLFAEALSGRLKPHGITVNSCHPGAVGTNMGVNRETGFGRGIMSLLKPFFRTPEEGADTAVFLATDPSVEKVTGAYFYNRKPMAVAKKAQDRELSEKLWRWTEEFTGVSFKEMEKNMGNSSVRN